MRILLTLLLFNLSQCGYNWGHQTRSLPGGHRTVHVALFKNQTQMTGVETAFTQALTRELIRSGFAIVTSKEAAEVVITGAVIESGYVGSGTELGFVAKNYTEDPAARTSHRYTASFFTVFRLALSANLKAVRARDQQVIWNTSVRGQDVVRGARLSEQGIRSSNVLYNESRRKQTVQLIAQDMMSEAFDRLTENF